MTRTLIAAMLTLAALQTRAADPWTRTDAAAEAAFAAIVVVDYAQTRYAVERGLPEENPLLGTSPGRPRLAASCAAAVAAHALVTWALPREWRPFWHMLSISVEAANVGTNAGVVGGMRLAF